MAVSDVVPGQTSGARQTAGLWKIYVKTNDSRKLLLQHGINFKDRQIKLYDIADPYVTEKIPSEKVIFRDIPLNYDDSILMDFIKMHPNLSLRSDII